MHHPTFVSTAESRAAAENEEAATAYLSKMQMLRELGFLSDASAEAEALARSQEQLNALQAGTDKATDESAGLQTASQAVGDSLVSSLNMTEADRGVPLHQQGAVTGAAGQKTDEQRCSCCYAGVEVPLPGLNSLCCD